MRNLYRYSKICLGFRTCFPGAMMIVILALFSISCNETVKRPAEMKAQSALDLDPRLKNIDSLVIVYYDDPFGEDSLRYTRYYKQVNAVPGDSLFGQLKGTHLQGEKKTCRGEGKIWCYKEGKIVQTLYFSTRCEECCFLYLIRDGNFYYSRANPVFLSWLSSQKARIPN